MTEFDDAGGATGGTPIRALWNDLLADADATAEEYEREGWETLQLHPGDVTARRGDNEEGRVGLDVLVPDDEYEALEQAFEAGFAADDYEVYRTTAMGTVLLLVVVRDEDADRAVLIPAYYSAGPGAEAMFERAVAAGELHTYVRRLSGDRVEFRHDDPELFLPDEGAAVEEVPEDEAEADADRGGGHEADEASGDEVDGEDDVDGEAATGSDDPAADGDPAGDREGEPDGDGRDRSAGETGENEG